MVMIRTIAGLEEAIKNFVNNAVSRLWLAAISNN